MDDIFKDELEKIVEMFDIRKNIEINTYFQINGIFIFLVFLIISPLTISKYNWFLGTSNLLHILLLDNSSEMKN